MVAGNKRSKTFKQKQVVTPSGKVVTRYSRKKIGVAKCQLTGQKLNGMPRVTKAKLRKMTLSKKRPTRPFAGVLSPAAMKRVLIEKVRD